VPRTVETAVIVNETRGTVVCERAELANTPWRRLRGLLGRSSLPEGDGMLIVPAPSVHSAFMRFEFDAVFLDRDMKVLRLAEQIPSWRARSARRARSVLELAAGQIAARGVQVGDQLAVKRGQTGRRPETAAAS
jgi:uncharacterized membrane protein (UPF0127 family)